MNPLSIILAGLHAAGPVLARAPEFINLFHLATAALHPHDQVEAQSALKALQDGNDAGHSALQAKLAELAKRA